VAGTLVQAEFIYSSGLPSELYHFTVVYNRIIQTLRKKTSHSEWLLRQFPENAGEHA